MRSITLKLTLTFLAVSLAGVALVAVIIWGTTSLAFNQFLLDRSKSDFLAAATTYYQANGTWDGISEALTKQGLIPAFQPDPNSPPSSQPGSTNPGPPLPFALADQNGTVIVRGGPFHSGDSVPASILNQGQAITINGQRVGTILNTGNPPNRNPSENRYLAQTNEALLIAACGAALAAFLISQATAFARPNIRDAFFSVRSAAVRTAPPTTTTPTPVQNHHVPRIDPPRLWRSVPHLLQDAAKLTGSL